MAGNPYVNAVLGDTPVSFWRGWEPTGAATLADLRQGYHHGTFQSGTALGTMAGPLRDNATAMLFNGTSGYVEMGSVAALKPTNLVAIEAWIYVTDNTRARQCIVSTGDFSNFGYSLYLETNSAVFRIGNGASAATASFTGISNNTWYHIVGVYNGSGLTIYVSGVARASSTLTGPISYTGITHTRIGQFNAIAPSGYFGGAIANVAVYASASMNPQAHYLASSQPCFFSCLIGGVEKGDFVNWLTLDIDQELGSRKVAHFTLEDKTGGRYIPNEGDEIILSNIDGASREFFGSVDEVDSYDYEAADSPGGSVQLNTDVACVSREQVFDRFVAANTYDTPMTAGAMFKDLINTYASSEGLITWGVADGPTIDSAVFPYIYLTDCANDIKNLTGYSIWIDDYGVVFLKARADVLAPWNLDDSAAATWQDVRGFHFVQTRQNYRNKQYMRAGVDTTTARTESFKGDGTRKTFNVSFPVALVPTIAVNGVGKTVGIRGVDTGKDWYWNKNENEISEDDGGTALTTSDTLAVTYQGLFPISVVVQDDTEIAARIAIEGGSGVYESVDQDASVNSTSLAIAEANGFIERYGIIKQRVNFWTYRTGLRVGQIIYVKAVRFGILTSTAYLINNVQIQGTDGWPGFKYTVDALSGEAVGGWVEFFQDLAASTRQFVIRENEVLVIVRNAPETLYLAESMSYTSQSPESRIGFAVIGSSEIG